MTKHWIPPWPDLRELMYRARIENKWFFCRYAEVKYSPDALQLAWDEGNFQWGACNWELIDPPPPTPKYKNHATLIEEARDARELVLDLFVQACSTHRSSTDTETKYDNECMSTYEYAQEKLIEWGMIKKEDCIR